MDQKKTLGGIAALAVIAAASTPAYAQTQLKKDLKVSDAAKSAVQNPASKVGMWTQAGWGQGGKSTRINPDGTVLTRAQALATKVPSRHVGGPAGANAMWTQLGWMQGGKATRTINGRTLTVREALAKAKPGR